MNIDSKTFEHSILYQSIKSPYFMGSIIEHVDIKFFNDKDVKNIFRQILSFYKSYSKYPNLTEIKTILSDEATKSAFINVVETFKGLETDIDIDVLLQQTEQYFREKSIVNTILDIGENFRDLTHTEIAEKVTTACGLTIITDIGFDYFKSIEEHILWLQSGQNKISTGFPFLDKKLKGGFNADGRALYVIMGGTNSGKSIVLGNLAANVIRQNKCIPIISLEMDEQLYSQRMSANFAEIEMDEIKNEIDEFRSTINTFKENNPDAKLILKEFPPGKLTVAGLDAYLAKLKKRGYDFGAVFLDYITLMRVEVSNGMYENGKQLAEDVRALSYKYAVSFITPIQANRGGVDGGQPKLDNVSESMGIAHTADFIVSIWREEDDVETGTMRIGVIKNRIGENFGVQMFELNKYLKLKEVDEVFEEDKESMGAQLKEQMSALSIFEELNLDVK